MKKLLLVLLAAILILPACVVEDTSGVNTGGSNEVSSEDSAADVPEKTFTVNFSDTFKKVKVNIPEIKISPTAVKVGINYENTGDKISWFPDQGNILLGDLQLNVDIFSTNSLVTGDIAPGAKSDGVLVFKPGGERKIDVEKIDKIKFDLGEIYPDDLSSSKKVTFEIPVK